MMMDSCRAKSKVRQTWQRNEWNIDASPATRGVRDWRQDGGETTSKTPQLPRVTSVAFGTEGVLLERSCWPRGCAIARACGGGRFELLPKAAVLLPQLYFIAAVARFRTVLLWFVQRSGTRGDTVRTQHKTQTAAPGFEAAAQRINADIRGSALPIARKKAKQ